MGKFVSLAQILAEIVLGIGHEWSETGFFARILGYSPQIGEKPGFFGFDA
jgi:hypothetical protein